MAGPVLDFALVGPKNLCRHGTAEQRQLHADQRLRRGGAGWACLLDAAGALTCFGDGVLAGQPTGGGFRDVAVGTISACAVDASGAPACGYDGDSCQEGREVPAQISSLSAASCQVCGIDDDGLGACWPRYWAFAP